METICAITGVVIKDGDKVAFIKNKNTGELHFALAAEAADDEMITGAQWTFVEVEK